MADEKKPNDTKKQEKPKIAVDDDWKAQARAEKQKLAKQVDKTDPSGTDQQTPQQEEAGQRQLPPANFATLVSSLVTQILFSLGGVEDPKTQKRYVDLDLAKHHIDMLSVIEEKTQGNLTDQEKKLLDQALYEVRMQYVQIAQHSSRVGQ